MAEIQSRATACIITMRSFLTLVALCFASVVNGAIGPTASLFIENETISPDGFSRSYVHFLVEAPQLSD